VSSHFHVDLTQTGSPEILYRLQKAILGIGSIGGPFRQKSLKAHHKSAFKFKVYSFEQAQALAALLWKYLSTQKRLQIAQALSSYHQERRSGVGGGLVASLTSLLESSIPQESLGPGYKGVRTLTEEEVKEIRRRRAQGETLQAIATRLGRSVTTIQAIATRRTWNHVP
jgi:hypothetical protein